MHWTWTRRLKLQRHTLINVQAKKQMTVIQHLQIVQARSLAKDIPVNVSMVRLDSS